MTVSLVYDHMNRLYVEHTVQDLLIYAGELMQEDRYDEAIDFYGEVISLQPDGPELASAHYNRAQAYLSLTDDLDLYVKDLSEAIQLYPDYVEAYYDRGFVYLFDKNEINLAIEDFTKLIQLEPNDGEIYCLRGISWLCQRDWENAKVDLVASQDKGFDIAYLFWDFFGTVEKIQRA